MRAVVAVAEQTEDPFRGICLVTLVEICKFWPGFQCAVRDDDRAIAIC